ncbi:nucleotidyltransferase family protein [Marinobacterium sedimentorum]|uniref:nucleotidyltransferase family protein n=1 Tax=Marinobacterium sedimentorum TaxID=2927804 RepID=UPI0020C5B839|nr:nucleotidyltransferase family protein [Marinobacterium sedimentorum]MCP8687671.1 nucleotidyltransferase family protein [Marinobacterium sedimentorum]
MTMPENTEIQAGRLGRNVAETGDRVLALVMAAGRARRFGTDKRQEKLLQDCTLLAATVQSMAAAFNSVRVVIRSDDDPAELGLASATQVVCSPRADQGLGFSIADGFRALYGSQATAAAVLLGDMPCIEPETFAMLVEQAAADRIVRPEYQGKPGHPVIFGRNFWDELAQLQDEEGARSVIQRHPEACMRIRVDDPGVLMDADRPEDLQALRERHQSMRGAGNSASDS